MDHHKKDCLKYKAKMAKKEKKDDDSATLLLQAKLELEWELARHEKKNEDNGSDSSSSF